MKAIILTTYGSPDVLELKEVEKPSPGENEVLVRVYASSVNDWDDGIIQGTPFINRLLYGLLEPKIGIPGADVAGHVEAAGRNVQRFKPGDEVWGDLCNSGWGAFAEYVCVPENALELKPANLAFPEAAAVPQAGVLALQALHMYGEIKPGQQVLINGAGGGAGTFAIQMAKSAGAKVTGVDRADKLEKLYSVGADHVIDYAEKDFTRLGKQYDLILDVKTNRSPFDYARALKPGGLYVTVGGSLVRIFQILLLSPLIRLFTDKHMRLLLYKPNKGLDQIKELIDSGKAVPVIDRSYRLGEITEAFRHFERADHKGKIVITVD